MPLTEKELIERDAKRNIGEELLAAIQDVKSDRLGAVYLINHATTCGTAEDHTKR